MNSKIRITGLSLLASLALVKAGNINVPDGSFQNVNAIITPPLIGVTSGNIGTWSAAFTNLLTVGGQMASSNAAASGWLTPPNGCTNELNISLPASVAASAGISETLTNQLLPNSVYTLTVDLSQQSSVNLIGGCTLSLFAVGSTNLASVGGAVLTNLLNSSTGYLPVSLTYKTPNTVPTNAVGISLAASGLAGIGGNIFVDDFQLSVNPIQVQLASSINPSHDGNSPSFTLSGQNGTPGATFEIETCNNLFNPQTVWVNILTNQFDTNGNFSQTFTVNTNISCLFFRTALPAN